MAKQKARACPDWGRFGDEPPCSHLVALLDYLRVNRLDIWSEHGSQPDGWVNVHCESCHRTYETTLDPNINRSGEHDA